MQLTMATHEDHNDAVPAGCIQCPKCHEIISNQATPHLTPKAAMVLSLDGGGIKGYSSLLILRKIMAEVAETERTKEPALTPEELQRLRLNRPSAYFDYIVGTSTGGLIATMLGRLDLTVDQCITEYQRLGAEVFAHPRRAHAHNKLWAGSKYDCRLFEKVIEDVVSSYKRPWSPEDQDGSPETDFGPWRLFKDPPTSEGQHHCKTVAVAVKNENGMAVPYLFRSYIHPKTQGTNHHYNPSNNGCPFEILQVARATSAAPGYFSAVRMPVRMNWKETDHVFMDGGIRANNPSPLAWNEVLQMARIDEPNISPSMAVGCFISIGTGKSKYQIFGRERQNAISKYLNMYKAPRKMLTDTDPYHSEMLEKADQNSTPYYRFNVQHGLHSMMLDEWTEKEREIYEENRAVRKRMSTIDYLTLATETYLETPDGSVLEDIKAAAKVLVNYRRARAANRPLENGTAS